MIGNTGSFFMVPASITLAVFSGIGNISFASER